MTSSLNPGTGYYVRHVHLWLNWAAVRIDQKINKDWQSGG